MTLDYRLRAEDFMERHLSGEKLELDYQSRLSLTVLLLENGFEVEGNADDFEIAVDFTQNQEYLRIRKEGEKVVGFDRLAPLDLFVDPRDSDYRTKQNGRVYTLISGEGEEAYSSYQQRLSDLEHSLSRLKGAQKDYDNNAPNYFLTDLMKGGAWGLLMGGLVLPLSALWYGLGNPEAPAWLSNGWATVPTGFIGWNALYHLEDRLITRSIQRSNQKKAGINIQKYQAELDSRWEDYKQNYLPTAEFNQQALKKALGLN